MSTKSPPNLLLNRSHQLRRQSYRRLGPAHTHLHPVDLYGYASLHITVNKRTQSNVTLHYITLHCLTSPHHTTKLQTTPQTPRRSRTPINSPSRGFISHPRRGVWPRRTSTWGLCLLQTLRRYAIVLMYVLCVFMCCYQERVLGDSAFYRRSGGIVNQFTVLLLCWTVCFMCFHVLLSRMSTRGLCLLQTLRRYSQSVYCIIAMLDCMFYVFSCVVIKNEYTGTLPFTDAPEV
jgi:hypothetical protein